MLTLKEKDFQNIKDRAVAMVRTINAIGHANEEEEILAVNLQENLKLIIEDLKKLGIWSEEDYLPRFTREAKNYIEEL